MDLSKILSISGKGGLFRLISQTKTGALVESLIDGKKVPAFASDRISALEDISIFTTEKEESLKKVLQSIFTKEDGGNIPFDPSKASEQDLVKYMREILPDFDEDRVYPSDMKKLFKWYNILNKSKLIDLNDEEETEKSESSQEQDNVKEEEAKPAKKTSVTKKKTSAPKTVKAKSVTKASPAKNTATRKSGDK